jgi:hypothetical protein
MQIYCVILQGYDREAGLSFSVSLRVRGQTIREARALALEEAVRQRLPVAVVAEVTDLGPAPRAKESGVISVSSRTYFDEVP